MSELFNATFHALPIPLASPTFIVTANRLSGLMIGIPSLMTNISILNCLILVYKGTPMQMRYIFATVLAMAVDVMILVTLSGWFLFPGWTGFTKCVTALSILKRIYSIHTVSVTFLR